MSIKSELQEILENNYDSKEQGFDGEEAYDIYFSHEQAVSQILDLLDKSQNSKLDDLENRIKQFVEVNELYLGKSDKEDKTIHDQNATYNDVLSLIKQLKKNGEIYRGNEYVPDAIEPMVTKNKWQGSKMYWATRANNTDVRKVIKEELE